MTGSEPRPVLWQLELSHYNEKVRWALDFKRIDHIRRPLLPGAHLLVARRLTNGACETTPVLTLDETSIGESSQIIAALERHRPEPSLYPADEPRRTRALALEALCDVELGEHVRRAAYAHLLLRPDLLLPSFLHNQPPLARALLRAVFPALRAGMRRRFRVSEEKAAESRGRVLAAVGLLERTLREGGTDTSSATASPSPTSRPPRCCTRSRVRPPSRIRFRRFPRRRASSWTHWPTVRSATGWR